MGYDISSFYSLRSKGFELYDGFYRVKDSLFVLGLFENAETKKKDLTIASIHWATMRVPVVKAIDRQNILTNVLDDELYFINGRQILRWTPGKTEIDELFIKDSLWPKSLASNKYLMKTGNYLLFRETEDQIKTYNLLTGKFGQFEAPEPVVEPNSLYKYLPPTIYSTSAGVFYMEMENGVQRFKRYDPATDTHEAIPFPDYKNEKFKSFTNIFQEGDRFYFLTEYIGKKERSVYRMFIY